MARADRAHRARSVARAIVAGGSPRREHVGARRDRGTRGALRYRARRRRVRAARPRRFAGAPGHARALRAEIFGAGQLARARVGHDAADLVVRHADVAARDRSHRLHGHVALDRSRAGPLRRLAHQTRASDPREQRDPAGAPRRARRGRTFATGCEQPISVLNTVLELETAATTAAGATWRERNGRAARANTAWTPSGADTAAGAATRESSTGETAARRRAEGTRASTATGAAASRAARPRAAAYGELLSARTTGHAATPPGPATGWRLVDEQEGPLVVMIASLVQADRLFLALADDTHHAAGDGAAAERAGHLRAAGRPRLNARGATGLS